MDETITAEELLNTILELVKRSALGGRTPIFLRVDGTDKRVSKTVSYGHDADQRDYGFFRVRQ